MSTSYQAVLFVGCAVNDLCKKLNATPDELEDMDLTIIHPYYDAPYDDCFVGIMIAESPTYFAYKLDEHENRNLAKLIEEATQEFQTRFGMQAALFISPSGW